MSDVQYRFADRAVFVTGAAGGMGLAIAGSFVAAGASVMMADIAPAERGSAAAASLSAAGPGRAEYIVMDVADDDSVRAAVSRCCDHFGGIDHAVNAAAIENEAEPLHLCANETFTRMLAVNVTGMFFSLKHELAAMLQRGGTHCTIVNVASTSAFRARPDQPSYTTTKHAVLGLTRSAAVDYARHGIRVNAICPGTVDTPMLQAAVQRRGVDPAVVASMSLLGRFGTPDEIAETAMWLSSSASSYTLGHALIVDAGALAG
jgi:NAD(P)-dependent dehydrogenase (short-subunit alcohol dehydrogenase family)